MGEQLFNLFVYVERGAISELGMAIHESDATDLEKISLLQSLVDSDYKKARRYRLPKALEWREYEAMMRPGRQLEVFEEMLRPCGAPINPLVVISPSLTRCRG